LRAHGKIPACPVEGFILERLSNEIIANCKGENRISYGGESLLNLKFRRLNDRGENDDE
jgi:hypothetical protein